VDDGIIDLTQYLRRRDEEEEDAEAGSTFALYGADGERARFALPLWRAIYLAGGERGGIVWQSEPTGSLHAFVVLDLGYDPPRTDFSVAAVSGIEGDSPPLVRDHPRRGLTVYLGEEAHRRWFLVVDGTTPREREVPPRDRDDILFLAGECAGLLFLRDFASEAEEDDEP